LGPPQGDTGAELGAPLGDSLGTALGEALGPALGEELGSPLGDTLGPLLGAELGAPLGDSLGTALGEALGPALGEELGPPLGDTLGPLLGAELGAPLGDELGLLLGVALGDELGPVLGDKLGAALGPALGQIPGWQTLSSEQVSSPLRVTPSPQWVSSIHSTTAQAVSHVTAVWAMARPTIFAFDPIVIAEPANTLPTKMLTAPMVRAVPRNQSTFSALAPLRSTISLFAQVVRVLPTLKTNTASVLF
jgi:hypothetical protein